MIHELSRRTRREVPGGQLRGAPRHALRIGNLRLRKGAFTGAHDRKPGRLELANEGTLFLDEIGDMSLIAQAKLLRVLEERRFERLGGNKSISVDFRLISATNRPLEQFVRDGRFREDLYYRVNAFAIRLPSLRERQVDIPVLAQRFLARYCAAQGMPLDSKSFRRRRSSCCSATTGPATSASSRARCRAPRCRRRAGRFARPTSNSCTRSPPRRGVGRPPAVARRVGARPHRARARGGRVEQEGSRAGPRHQPGHALPQDPRIPTRAGTASGGRRAREGRSRVPARTLLRRATAGFRGIIRPIGPRAGAMKTSRSLPGSTSAPSSPQGCCSWGCSGRAPSESDSLRHPARRILARVGDEGQPAARHQRVHDVGVLRGGFRLAAAARRERNHARRGGERVEPVHVPDENAVGAVPHAVQHGVARPHREGRRLGVRLARRTAAGGHASGVDIPKPLVGAATTYFVCNTALIATAIGLSTRQSIARVWNENFLWSAPSYFVGARRGGVRGDGHRSAAATGWRRSARRRST